MKKLLLLTLVSLIIVPLSAQQVLENFDGDTPISAFEENIYVSDEQESADTAWINLSYDSTLAGREGAACLAVDWKNDGNSTPWGGYLDFGYQAERGSFLDFSPYDTLTFKVYNKEGSTEGIDLVFIINEQADTARLAADEDDFEQWLFLKSGVYDTEDEWIEIKVPLYEIENAVGNESPNDQGLALPGWTGNIDDGKFDPAGVFSWGIEMAIGTGSVDSGLVYYDIMMLIGEKEIPLVYFDGRFVPSSVYMHTDWSGSVEVVDTEDYASGTNSIKWDGGDQYDGVYFDMDKSKNLVKRWSKDTLQFAIKADAGVGDLTLSFFDTDEDTGKVDYSFAAVYSLEEAAVGYDGSWKLVEVALKDFDRFAGAWDDDLGDMVDGEFDSTKVARFAILNEADSLTGKTLYLDDIWTGDPLIDVVPPKKPTGLTVTVNADSTNTITWTDVANESGEIYNIYYGLKLINNVQDAGVEVLDLGISEGVQTRAHNLVAPDKPAIVRYYYAISCTDESGNVSGLARIYYAPPNTAKGIPTISIDPPANFACDGNVSEWSGYKPVIISPDPNKTGYVMQGVVSNEADCSVEAYLGMDANYFYASYKVIDDQFQFDAAGNVWENDGLELFIGLYDFHGVAHTNFKRGSEPDYAIANYQKTLQINETDVFSPDSTWYSVTEKSDGYVIETRIPWKTIADLEGDDLFSPMQGYRIGLDFTVVDRDNNTKEGMMALSPKNNDDSYKRPDHWAFTWITAGDGFVGITDENNNIAYSFALNQNYPNPFNPQTTIAYSLKEASKVTISIFNILGQKIVTLVNKKMAAGPHQIKFNGAHLPTGTYFYRIQAGEFSAVKKMILIK